MGQGRGRMVSTVNTSNRQVLLRWLRVMTALALLTVIFVLIDFSFNRPDTPEHRFVLPDLPLNRPMLLREGSLQLIVGRFDESTLARLNSASRLSKISESFRSNVSRVDNAGYFVAFAYGENACPLDIADDGYIEICSDVGYDLLGRSRDPSRYPDLEIPVYRFSQNHSVLSIE